MTHPRFLLGILVALTVLVCAILINSCHSGSDDPQVLTAATQLRGDIDDDGQPSVGDAIGILRIVVGLDGANEAADADANGSTSVNDAIAVLRCVVGLAEWPLGEFTLPATRTIGPGVVVETDFTVGAEERVECLGDTTIQCDTATIAGELYALPGAPGADGADITIEAQGDVVLTGALYAGDGGDGDPAGTGGDGGDGGSVTVNSANGDITVGAEVETAAGAPDGFLGAGDGGDGADGTLGGHGGDGGQTRLACLSGTLTINQQADLFHIGSGGDGGDGSMTPAELVDYPETVIQLHNGGGDAGALIPSCAQLVGAALQDFGTDGQGNELRFGFFDDGVGDGGNGGNAGSFTCESVDTASTWAEVSPTDYVEPRKAVKGDRGGNTSTGQAGDGETVTVDVSDTTGNPDDRGIIAQATGGDGGSCEWDASTGGVVANYTLGLFVNYAMRGGNGGHAVAKGGAGAGGGSCDEGTWGGDAIATGGNGGNVKPSCEFWDEDKISVGNGGNGTAVGGTGGEGGPCCDDNPEVCLGPGWRGGPGGEAIAAGGKGGECATHSLVGEGGTGSAEGGTGGKGGSGEPGASGGEGGKARSRAGKGEPPGASMSIKGSKGGRGANCDNNVIDPDEDECTGLVMLARMAKVMMKRMTPQTFGLAAPAQGGEPRETTTDDDGRYCFSDVEPGDYQVYPDGSLAPAPNYWLPSMREVTKVDGEPLTGLHFTLTEGAQHSVTVEVIDENRAPVEGVDVTLLAFSGRPDCSGVTGANGVATIAGVWSGLYTVVIGAPAGFRTFPDTQRVMVTDANAWTLPVMLVEEE